MNIVMVQDATICCGGQDPWLTVNYWGWVGRVAVAVSIERSKHGAVRRLGMRCAVLDGT
jgi:hypothetical protein